MELRKMNFKKRVTKEDISKYARYITLVIVAVYLGLFIFGNKCYISYNEDGTINQDSLINAAIVIACSLIIVGFVFVKNKLSDKINMIVSYVLFFASPVFCYFEFEWLQKGIFGTIILSIRWQYYILNFMILSVILLTIFVITNSIKISIIGLTLVINIFGLVGYYVYTFRGVALVASDIFSFGTATSVMGGYHLFLDYHIFYVFIITLLNITLVSKLRSFKAVPLIKLRLGVVLCYLLYTGLFLKVFVFSNQLKEWHISVKLFKPESGYRKYGTFLAITRSIGLLFVEEPDGYSVDQIKELADQYSDDTNTGQTPNVIVVMDESFSDLKTVGDFETNEDYMPFVRSLKENTIKGDAYVSVFGGNTANTEFEFLTGNSIALLPANAIPYQLYIKNKFPSIIYNFEKLNYAGNVAMHPYYATGFNRKAVYPLLGFEKFISIDDFINPSTLRDKITDECDFDKIIEIYEETRKQSDNPFFMFNVTMQNHGGYINTDPNFEQKIMIENQDYYDEEAQTYLSLVKYTDEAVEKLIDYFKNIDEPTVIVFFGDHQPGLSKSWYKNLFGKKQSNLTDEELMAKYQVPFFAWANYDIQEESGDKVSMNYLSAYIFDKLGINLTKYQQFLLDVYEQVPVMNSLGYWGEDGNYYTYEDKDSPYYDVINEYRCVQYNNMHDKGNRLNSMFYLN